MILDTEMEDSAGGTGGRLARLVNSASQGGTTGPYLVVDLGRALEYLRGDEGALLEEAATELTDDGPESAGGSRGLGRRLLVLGASIALSYVLRRRFGRSGGESGRSETGGTPLGEGLGRGSTTDSGEGTEASGGRGLMTKLLILGAVVAAGVVLRRRSGSPGEAGEDAAEETESFAAQAAQTVKRRGEMVAEQIEAGTEVFAGQVQEEGERTAEQIGETADAIDEAEDQAVEQAEELESEAREMAEETEEAVGEMEASDVDESGESDVDESGESDVDESEE